MERKDKEKYATLEASVDSRTVDLGMEINCASCDSEGVPNKADLIVGNYFNMPAVMSLPAKQIVVFSPMCRECYIAHRERIAGESLGSPAIPLIHLGGESNADTEDTGVS